MMYDSYNNKPDNNQTCCNIYSCRSRNNDHTCVVAQKYGSNSACNCCNWDCKSHRMYQPSDSLIFPPEFRSPYPKRTVPRILNMNSILNLPLPVRCETIGRLVNECTNKELENFFPLLIDDLFGITNQIGWKLRAIRFCTNSYEYDILTKFLHPHGPVFKLCYKLLSDCHLKYDFPMMYLPSKVQQMIADGIVPSFYADKLQMDHKTRTPLGLALNPFELYMFHFVYHLVNPNIQIPLDPNQWLQWDLLYIRLIEDYLNSFLPCDGTLIQPLGNFMSTQTPSRSHSIYLPTRLSN